MKAISPESFVGNIVTTRVRIARNVWGYPFKATDEKTAGELVKKVNRALVKCGTFNLYYMRNLNEIDLMAMKAKHLISQALIDNAKYGAALVSDDESVSVMVNEEDVIREQCFMKGLRLFEAYKRIDAIDDELGKNLDFAFDDDVGYLTACPTNVGTGLRASVMLFLPALTLSGKIKEVYALLAEKGLTVRGAYGEGSKGEGYLYQISNEVTLGISEQNILKIVEDAVLSVCSLERKELTKLLAKREIYIMDDAKKAYGLLTNAVMISYEEFIVAIGKVKLGAMLGMLNVSSIESLDELITMAHPALIIKQYGRPLSALDRDLFRAEIVAKKLEKLKE